MENQKMNKGIATTRRCRSCRYGTFIMEDNLKEKKCKYCSGDLEIITQEKAI